MTAQERFDDHERRIKRLERDMQLDHDLHTQQIGDHAHRIDALERLSRTDLWASVAIGGYQQALTQVQEELRAVRADLAGVRGREVLGLAAEDKVVLIGLLNTVVDEVEAIKAQLADRSVGDPS